MGSGKYYIDRDNKYNDGNYIHGVGGAEHSGEFYVDKSSGYIYGPKNSGQYYIDHESGYITAPLVKICLGWRIEARRYPLSPYEGHRRLASLDLLR
jgi:hypothetical protein